MSTFKNIEGALVVDRMIRAIQENKQYLSDIDGAIADGDHGIIMNMGFVMTREAMDKDPGDFSHGLLTLAKILMMRIGGSMGPLYGKTFKSMGKTLQGNADIDAALLGQALLKAKESRQSGASFQENLLAMKTAAEKGRDTAEDMVAKPGRSSRLGEGSRGVIDAGAASCALLLSVIADTIIEIIN